MKNSVNNVIVLGVVGFGLHFPAWPQSVKVEDAAITESSAFKMEVSRWKEAELRLFEKQSFRDKRTGTIYSAGFALNKPKQGGMDCFLYVQPENATAGIIYGSDRAESAWDCVGAPAIGMRNLSDGSSPAPVVFAIFSYRAPGGETFKFPFAVEVENAAKPKFGQLQACIERQFERVELKDFRQLVTLAGKCKQKK
jgi:hypothetical protein